MRSASRSVRPPVSNGVPNRSSSRRPAGPVEGLLDVPQSAVEVHDQPPVQPGEVLAGKYRIERVLGAGGMGVVAAAENLQLGERVAIKFLSPEALRHPETVARFEREARLAVKIKSEHVARTLDVGRLEGGEPYIVMEYLEGTDVAAQLQRRGRFEVAWTVDLVLQACEALAEAHSVGIVHRDLKPANLFVTTEPDGSPSVKLLDFGISKVGAESQESPGITQTNATLGTPSYMSPEQLTAARSIDQRSDIWSLGVICYQLLTGELPFSGSSLAEVSLAILSRTAPPLTERRPELPASLVACVEHALRKDREQRPRNLAEWAEQLAAHGSEEAVRSLGYIRRVSADAGGVVSSEDTKSPARQQIAAEQGAARVSPPATGLRRVGWAAAALGFCSLGALALLSAFDTSGAEPLEDSAAEAADRLQPAASVREEPMRMQGFSAGTARQAGGETFEQRQQRTAVRPLVRPSAAAVRAETHGAAAGGAAASALGSSGSTRERPREGSPSRARERAAEAGGRIRAGSASRATSNTPNAATVKAKPAEAVPPRDPASGSPPPSPVGEDVFRLRK